MSNQSLYGIERFSPEKLIILQKNLFSYADGINGLPRNHSEVFNKRGWMLPFLFAYDDLLWGRWDYWFTILEKGTIDGSGPIPQIKWSNGSEAEKVKKMLRACLNHPDSTIDKFAEWLIWAMACNKEYTVDGISAELNEHYYKNFDLFLVLNYPTDYLSSMLSEETGKGYKGSLGYYPTPFHICEMMTKMTFSDDKDYKTQTITDPCIGCGAMLLPASNYTLRGFGQDISRIAVNLATIQMYWYAPWYAFHPSGLKEFDDMDSFIKINQNSLVKGQLTFTL